MRSYVHLLAQQQDATTVGCSKLSSTKCSYDESTQCERPNSKQQAHPLSLVVPRHATHQVLEPSRTFDYGLRACSSTCGSPVADALTHSPTLFHLSLAVALAAVSISRRCRL
eukprot:3854486-Amphidinium_carterae.1